MQTKLTLRLDDEMIRMAKLYSSRSGKSLSQLVEDYFAFINGGLEASRKDLTPRVRSLLGALAGVQLSEDDYRRHVEAKHQ
jgi:hypothetical protein